MWNNVEHLFHDTISVALPGDRSPYHYWCFTKSDYITDRKQKLSCWLGGTEKVFRRIFKHGIEIYRKDIAFLKKYLYTRRDPFPIDKSKMGRHELLSIQSDWIDPLHIFIKVFSGTPKENVFPGKIDPLVYSWRNVFSFFCSKNKRTDLFSPEKS